MFTRSIRFKNFSGKKNKLLNKKLIKIFKSENWLTKYPLLNSLNKNYNKLFVLYWWRSGFIILS